MFYTLLDKSNDEINKYSDAKKKMKITEKKYEEDLNKEFKEIKELFFNYKIIKKKIFLSFKSFF
ncbi:hypothetical protein ACOAK2_03345 [Aliarcobacter butzleri]|uniref:hypothetical protein n=1 Tax=Aliarcobacter butzleri TaxID=28197 RepID=UPI003B28D237